MKVVICIAVYFVLINITAFVMYGVDKGRAKRHEWRISENALVGMALIGGSVGALAGMKVFHHKTKKPKFFVGIPLILIVQVASAVLVVRAVL